MRKEIAPEQLEIEAQPGYRPAVIDTGITILPLGALGDREFELLSYQLMNSEIERGHHKDITKVTLMQGVGERGRDCVIYNGNSVCGLIQCKKYAGRVTRPQVIKEVLKFLLFAKQDASLMPDPDRFDYKIYASNDFTEPAIILIHSFKSEIQREVLDGTVERYILEIVEEYESFVDFRTTPPVAEICGFLGRISISSSNAADLSARIYRDSNILKLYFNVRSVVSVEDADQVVRKALDDYGLKYLTDEDLRDFKKRIDSTPESQRTNLGLFDFYGLDREFFRHIKAAGQKELFWKVTEIRTILDKYLMDFVNEQIGKRIYPQITENLLKRGKVHPFSVSFAAPYLYRQVSSVILASNLPEPVMKKVYPDMFLSKEELIREVSTTLLDASSKVMAGDYSGLVGDSEMVKLKIDLFRHMHQGFSSIDDARLRLTADLEIMLPVLDSIEAEVRAMLSKTRTIVIKDGSFFEDELQLKRMLQSTKDIHVR